MIEIKGQPRALPYLFLTEMWERFGFYVVQGLLVLYMSRAFGFSDDQSYTIQGLFTGLAYIAPIIGGFLADSLLGFKTSIYVGGLFLILGYGMLSLPFAGLFYPALATIIVGNGLFKPNISSLLGSLYENNTSDREAGFTIFYIGINIGVLLSGLSSGFIKNQFGWHAGFALACAGLVLGLIIFTIGTKKFAELRQHPSSDLPVITLPYRIGFVACCLLAIVLVSLLLQSSMLSKWLFPVLGVALLIFLVVLAMRQDSPYREKLYTLNALILSSIVFWMLFLQLFFSGNLFIDRLVDKHWLGMDIPTTVFYALESVFIILLGPGFAWSWHTLNRRQRNPSSFLKFVFAIVAAGAGFLVLAVSTYFPNASGMVNPFWIVLSYFFLTVGELMLSPIGLSAVTTLAPKHLVGMMMGIWFVALGFGGQFAGWLAKLSSVPASVTSLDGQLQIYRGAFYDFTWIAFVVAAGLFAIHLFLNKILYRRG
jgi:POT family proton-dependent oligopeptide transporter